MTISKLKKKLDTLFSQYIRRRFAEDNGMTTCFTCGVKRHWKEQHAGHFQSRRHMSTRWDETNVQVQCPKCNLFSQGEQYKFGIYLDENYGKGTAESLRFKANQIEKITKQEYLEKIEDVQQKIRELDEQ